MALLFAFLFPLLAFGADVPPLKARVTDLTGTLNAQQSAALEQALAEFESRKGAQIAVLLVPTTQPESIEQFAVRVQEAWQLGRRGVDDGVLLAVAKDDRRLHIEVGYGLEGILPDAIAKRIIDEDIVPRFKQNDFYGGVRAGAERIMRVVEGEKLPPPSARAPAGRGFSIESLIPVLFVVLIGGGILRAVFGRFLGAGIAGGVAGFAAWMIAGSLIVALIVGVVGFLLLLMGGGMLPSGGGYYRGGGGGWSSGGGGGWSGGGGRSGGGGASGSW